MTGKAENYEGLNERDSSLPPQKKEILDSWVPVSMALSSADEDELTGMAEAAPSLNPWIWRVSAVLRKSASRDSSSWTSPW